MLWEAGNEWGVRERIPGPPRGHDFGYDFHFECRQMGVFIHTKGNICYSYNGFFIHNKLGNVSIEVFLLRRL